MVTPDTGTGIELLPCPWGLPRSGVHGYWACIMSPGCSKKLQDSPGCQDGSSFEHFIQETPPSQTVPTTTTTTTLQKLSSLSWFGEQYFFFSQGASSDPSKSSKHAVYPVRSLLKPKAVPVVHKYRVLTFQHCYPLHLT